MSEYFIHVNMVDTSVAFECEADRAKREGFTGVEARQRDTALHIRNAYDVMEKLCPEGHKVRMRIMFDFTPDVNPVRRRT